ncbi:MICOS complex [Salix suchowensis]|nr:MICOS complex [Salix suchowensis]
MGSLLAKGLSAALVVGSCYYVGGCTKGSNSIDLPNVETKKDKVETRIDVLPFKTEQKVGTPSDLPHVETKQKVDGHLGMESPKLKIIEESNEGTQVTQVKPQDATVPVEREIKRVQTQNVAFGEGVRTSSLLDSYHLDDKAKKNTETESAINEMNNGYLMKDGQLVMDFLEAMLATKKRQAELGTLAFVEEKIAIRVRELMHVEEVVILDKRAEAATAIKTLQERIEEKLRVELEHKLKKLSEFTKAELLATSAWEKIHSIHKLALEALALEDALYKGLPIQQKLDALNTYLDGIDKDSLLLLVLSTLLEETKHHGPNILLELNQKGNLRHYILIPPSCDDILAHALVHFKEVDPCDDDIESIISRVEGFLAEGELAKSVDALQEGVQGNQTEEITGDWVRRARNMAITEQALTVLQPYATCIGLTQ